MQGAQLFVFFGTLDAGENQPGGKFLIYGILRKNLHRNSDTLRRRVNDSPPGVCLWDIGCLVHRSFSQSLPVFRINNRKFQPGCKAAVFRLKNQRPIHKFHHLADTF